MASTGSCGGTGRSGIDASQERAWCAARSSVAA
jgi:hypothetical protein